MSKNLDKKSETIIKVMLSSETDEDGNDMISSNLIDDNAEQFKALSLALLGNESLREMTLLTSAYIIATSDKPQEIASSIIELANDIMKENIPNHKLIKNYAS